MKKTHTHKKTIVRYPKMLTILFLLVGTAIILFPIKKTPILAEVQFVRNSQQLQGFHGAADNQRDYLFNDTSTGTTTNTAETTINSSSEIPGSNLSTYTGQLYTGQLVITGVLPTTTETTIITGTVQPQQTQGYENLINAIQQSVTQLLGISSTIVQPEQTGLQQTFKDCTTPRGKTVKHKDFVLAYEQRTDVNTICNVERRICNDGALEGSYTQNSCKEDITYNYQKAEVISYNEKIIDPLVQPGEASNAGGAFSTQGKVNETLQPTTVAGTTNQPVIGSQPTVSQTQITKADCFSPRGTIIKHGQFVKSYKSPIGLIDVPCETQLRLCINGNLKGNFVNKTCTFKNMTYHDYIAGNRDITVPTPQDLLDTLTDTTDSNTNTENNNGIFDRVKSLFGK